MFALFRSKRRRRLLAAPLDAALRQRLESDCRFLARLDPPRRERLVSLARVFASEKYFESARGGDGDAVRIDDHLRLVIALQACWLLVGHEPDPIRDAIYPNVTTIIVYPGAYWNTQAQPGPGGVVTEGRLNLGEAHDGPGLSARGPVLLSWPQTLAGARAADQVITPEPGPDGQVVLNAWQIKQGTRNLVIHEFAHKLDMLDGIVDGTPPLPVDERECEKSGRAGGGGVVVRWQNVMSSAFRQLRQDASRGRATILDTYGAQNPAEFFAVSVECFFMQPRLLRWKHPDLFEVLSCVFRMNPA